jgi:hypothetical protein
VRNPHPQNERASVRLQTPAGWSAEPVAFTLGFDASGRGEARFTVRPPAGARTRRARVAADLTVGSRRLGQLAEALVTVE